MKILGLDLGTNSVGWAVVEKDGNKILDSGVRIFPEGVVDKGKGEKEKSKNATRTEKRQIRRQYFRKRLRKIKLLQLLIEQKMCPLDIEELNKWKKWDRQKKTEARKFPDSEEFVKWLKLNPYELRDKALNKELTLFELGRIFYHLIQRRGFLSSRKGKDDSTIYTKGKPEENILPINETKKKIGNQTLGKYLNAIRPKEEIPYHMVIDCSERELRVRGRYTLRDMYIEEFDRIWQKQAPILGLDKIMVERKKIRQYRGTLAGKRNAKRIQYLKQKYGDENILIETTHGAVNVTTKFYLSLKECLAGKIENIIDDKGENKLHFKSDESILFWQRPLRSQKSLISNCRFENELPVIKSNGKYLLTGEGEIQKRSKKPCPLSHPEFELFRAYQFINNIKFGRSTPLIKEQRQIALDVINNQASNFDFKKIPEALNITYEKFNFPDKFKVLGNYTIKTLKPLFNEKIWEESYEDIWHCFYFYNDNDKLYEKLRDDFEYNNDITTIEKIKLKEGYGSISLKAIRNIVPFLIKGYQYDKAVIFGGVKNAFGKRWEYFQDFHGEIEREINRILGEDNKEGEAIDKIKEYLSSPINNFGFKNNDPHFTRLYHHSMPVEHKRDKEKLLPEIENLRNPIVQQGLNETRRLVNTLLTKYQELYGADFKFDRINVEMGRDLRNNKAGRQEVSIMISDNEKKNKDARERLAEYGLQPSRENIQKYLMYKEIEDHISGPVICPYTGKVISINNLLGRDNSIQIEHIIPYSVSLDDSFGNKTLCEANFNRDKGERTPYEFYLRNSDYKLWGIGKYDTPEDGWNEISERAFRILPYRKAKKFTIKRTDLDKSDFIERQLNDSRYIAKKAVEILSHICEDVRVMPGQLTAELRHLWGLNNILQPVININDLNLEVDENQALQYYLLIDENGICSEVIPKLNKRPQTNDDEILIPGYVQKSKFNSRFAKINFETPELPDGKYWARLKVSDEIKLMPKYADKPETDENSIVFKGIIKKGFFNNETSGRIKTNEDDGLYWAKFNVIRATIEPPSKNKKPRVTRNQVLLFGIVKGGEFNSYVYKCNTDLPDGKYWMVLDLNKDSVDFKMAKNPAPQALDNQIMTHATVNETGACILDIDQGFAARSTLSAGKYYAIIDISSKPHGVIKMENDPPSTEKGQTLLEGNVWVDKYTGEIKFDPKKNRDDHRHHAIDAITIALTDQGFLQRLSTYNAQRKEKQRQKLDSTERFPEPWLGFTDDVKKSVNSILVSHKKSKKSLTKNRKGYSVRGQLHKDFVFGKRHAPNQGEAYHQRVKIAEMKNHKDVSKVVDDTIRNLIRVHLKENCNVDVDDPNGYNVPNDAFYKDGVWRLFLPNKKGHPVPIKKIRKKKSMGNAVQLKSRMNQYVDPQNNHHVLIYKDHEGNLQEDVVQFWTIVERKLQGEEIYQLPEGGESIVTILEINDMFLLGLSNEEYEEMQNNREMLGNHLFRVQKLSNSFYTFRAHNASTLLNKEEEIYIQSFVAWEKLNPIKVNINFLGDMEFK